MRYPDTREIGKRYERLLVLEYSGRNKAGKDQWLCKCDCGKNKIVLGQSLRQGKTRSCGCLDIESKTKHGLSRHPLYNVWHNMIRRCYDENNSRYSDYGGRGIKVFEPWHRLENFVVDIGERPLGATLDRIDVNQGYFPGNVRWATPKEQNLNKRVVVDVCICGRPL